jgi:hypothetical protein
MMLITCFASKLGFESLPRRCFLKLFFQSDFRFILSTVSALVTAVTPKIIGKNVIIMLCFLSSNFDSLQRIWWQKR